MSDTLSTPPSADDSAPSEDLLHAGRRRSRTDRMLMTAWFVSVMAHLILFGVMVAFPWVAQSMITDSTLHSATTELRPLADAAKFSVVPEQVPLAKRPFELDDRQKHIQPEQHDALSALSRVEQQDLSIVGIGTGGGDSSKYRLHPGSATGPTFFGLGGEARAARRIVYVVDRSGSMIGMFDSLRDELKRSIDQLRKSQKFHVIFYSTDPPVENPPRRLINAIRAAKDRTFEFIDSVQPMGATQPLEAMRRAFQIKPDLIYFLSDGEIPVATELLELLQEENKDEKVRIYTIAYVSSAGRPLLEQIAREHNGQFRYVSEYELR